MRKLVLYMHVSLDGYIEGADGDMSWMTPDDDELWNELFLFLEGVDLLALGGGMWSDYRRHWKKVLSESGSPHNDLKYAKLAARTRHVVFSNTITDPEWDNAIVVPGNAVVEMGKIKEQPGRDIQLVGGSKFAGSLIESGLVDEYRILVHPAIVTKGKSFFQQLTARRSLELSSARRMHNGVALLMYRDVTKGF